MDWHVLGIDNGFKGYACLLNKRTGAYRFIPTPVRIGLLTIPEFRLEDAESNEYDFPSMVKLAEAAAKVSQGACVAVIEDTISTHSGHRRANQTSAHTRDCLLRGKTLWSAACELAGIQTFAVTPARWQAGLKLLGKPKEASVEVAKQMGVTLPASKEYKVGVSVDAADAFLLAKWFAVNGVMSKWE